MNMLLTAKKLKSGSEKHCILSILIPAKITSLSVDITPIHFSAKRNKIIEAAVKKIVPIKTWAYRLQEYDTYALCCIVLFLD